MITVLYKYNVWTIEIKERYKLDEEVEEVGVGRKRVLSASAFA